MNYDDLRQWRNICELINTRKYKWLPSYSVSFHFPFLTPEGKPKRQELWTLYAIQFVRWGVSPDFAFSRYARRSRYDDEYEYGWWLRPDWYQKIDFLEKVVLFDRFPEDLAQPWRQHLWEYVQQKMERESAQEIAKQQKELARQMAKIPGNCPAGFDCHAMTGCPSSVVCPNFTSCQKFYSLL